MDFQIPGTLNVTRAGRPVLLGGYVKRALLSQLLLKPNRIVSTADLVKALWPEGAPPTARKILQNAVSDLRRILRQDRPDGEPLILLTHTPGYLLCVATESVDFVRFQRLAGTGRAELTAGAYESAISHSDPTNGGITRSALRR
jgi:DNA-binding SARP family transcriptional activator